MKNLQLEEDIYIEIAKIKDEIKVLKDLFLTQNLNLYGIIASKQIAISNLYIALSNVQITK